VIDLSRTYIYQEDMEAEMKRLRLELKQTMDMYSTACKEALTAKQKVSDEPLINQEIISIATLLLFAYHLDPV
jgi:hypothetical protein